jgi:hypothetical protein
MAKAKLLSSRKPPIIPRFRLGKSLAPPMFGCFSTSSQGEQFNIMIACQTATVPGVPRS